MISKVLIADTARYKTTIFQLNVIGTFLQAIKRSNICIVLLTTDGDLFPIIQAILWQTTVLLVKVGYRKTLSGKYWYAEFNDWLAFKGITIYVCPKWSILFTINQKRTRRKIDQGSYSTMMIGYIL
jgi:hypothetical protein